MKISSGIEDLRCFAKRLTSYREEILSSARHR